MDITKIKYDGARAELLWEILQAKSDTVNKYSMESADQPTEAFKKALQALAPFVCDICEFEENYKAGMTIRGITCTYSSEKRVMGVMIHVVKKLPESNRVFPFNTPFLPEASPVEGGAELARPCAIAIRELLREAEKYINGERAQIDMFPAGTRKAGTKQSMKMETADA